MAGKLEEITSIRKKLSQRMKCVDLECFYAIETIEELIFLTIFDLLL
jgi:hypothetical protein